MEGYFLRCCARLGERNTCLAAETAVKVVRDVWEGEAGGCVRGVDPVGSLPGWLVDTRELKLLVLLRTTY